jgi:hypothetical protein
MNIAPTTAAMAKERTSHCRVLSDAFLLSRLRVVDHAMFFLLPATNTLRRNNPIILKFP